MSGRTPTDLELGEINDALGICDMSQIVPMVEDLKNAVAKLEQELQEERVESAKRGRRLVKCQSMLIDLEEDRNQCRAEWLTWRNTTMSLSKTLEATRKELEQANHALDIYVANDEKCDQLLKSVGLDDTINVVPRLAELVERVKKARSTNHV